MAKQELEFEYWWDIYVDEMRKLGWQGMLDHDSAINDYNDGMSPEEAARTLFNELTQG